MKLKMKDCHAT